MRGARLATALFFLVAFAALIWPIYSIFGNARPLILGIPPSLFYVSAWLVSSFLVLLALYLYEEH